MGRMGLSPLMATPAAAQPKGEGVSPNRQLSGTKGNEPILREIFTFGEREAVQQPSHPHARHAAWRKAEWIGCALALLILSGALLPLLLAQDGSLDGGDKSKLRLLDTLAYVLTLGLLLRHPAQLLLAVLRNIPMLLLIAQPFVSVLWSIAPSFSLRRAIALLMSMLLAYLLAIRFTPRQQTLLIASVLGLAMGLSLLTALAAPRLAFMPDESAMRGIFVHKNVLGWMSGVSVLVGIALMRDPLRRMRRGGWYLAVTGFICVLLSESVTSLLVACFAIVLFLTYRLIGSCHGLGRFVVKLVLLQIAVLLALAVFNYLLPLLDALGKDATLTGRVPLWDLVDPEIARRPILGYGYGVFWSEANPTAWRIWEAVAWRAPHAHNGYRDLLLSIGLPGAAVFCIVILQALRRGLALQYTHPGEGWVWCTLMIGLSLVLNLSESMILMQNDLVWVLTSTAILTVSFRYPALNPQLDRHQRLAVTAA